MVAAASPRSAWAVGATAVSPGRNSKPVILHWNGSAWRRVRSPFGIGVLFGMTVRTARSAWAVGSTGPFFTSGRHQPVILHWNGRAWTRVRLASVAGSALLAGVTAPSATSAWAVGAASRAGRVSTLILHWNGRVWK
jgi:hypothetical protein